MLDFRRMNVPKPFIDKVIAPSCQGDERILNAFRAVPREFFMDEAMRLKAYVDSAQPIGYGQTISQPSLVAMMLHELETAPTHKVLEIGAGSGYVTALLGKLVDEVYALELLPELCTKARDKIREMMIRNVRLMTANGAVGYAEKAPYDRIIVSAGAKSFPPALLEQLADDGIIIIPIDGVLTKVLKSGERKPLAKVAFVDFINS
ncbi:MAG: protein-L-isoaspartate(D-aspartate) O-methyltransferase [Deferribacteraceae bacterium]|jgi:protein-L-isoaspartate(D-aspartate) O-methyltransferase|nr:protein-L-isoaspartate(D-aspartate) O-methyltransferase [Deferribacteraceae bacterium]